jgi:UDP-GlcNAc:undecaprenyl-phosphate GlcNAc-1-phosphate transferase
MIKYLALFIIACAVSVSLTPLVRWVALRFGAIDLPGGRKIHKEPIPRLGGLAIFIAFYLVIFISLQFAPNIFPPNFLNGAHLGWLFLASTIVVGVGVVDDFRTVSPGIKLLFQIVASIIIATACFRIEVIFGSLHLGILSIPVTVLWIVAVTNAVNLIDGLDGLAAGTSLVVCISLSGIALLSHNENTALALTVLAGSILGFLKYNFNPASIFLGDSGAYFLGFILSILSLMSHQTKAATIGILAPIVALGLPIMDTVLAMFRRLLKSLHIIEIDEDNNRVKVIFANRWSVFAADRAHIHHKLLQKGWTQKKVVTLLYAISASFGVIALISVYFDNLNYALFITLIGGMIYIAVRKLGYQEIRILSNGTFLPLIYTRTMNKKALRAFMDAALIAAAYYLAMVLRFEGLLADNVSLYYWLTLPLVLIVKLTILYIFSRYRLVWLYTGVSELLSLVKAVALGCAASALLLWVIPKYGIISYSVLIIDFNLLLLFVAGTRMSFRILDHLHTSNKPEGKKVLIYGAGKRGLFALKEILNNPRLEIDPIGFIDDSVRFEGRQIHGLPVFGSMNSLEGIIKDRQVSEVIICREALAIQKLDQLKEICRRCQISLSMYHTTFELVDDAIMQHAEKDREAVLVD